MILPTYPGKNVDEILDVSTFPETNSLHLKMDGWKTILSFWGPANFQVRNVCFREGKSGNIDIFRVSLLEARFLSMVHRDDMIRGDS